MIVAQQHLIAAAPRQLCPFGSNQPPLAAAPAASLHRQLLVFAAMQPCPSGVRLRNLQRVIAHIQELWPGPDESLPKRDAPRFLQSFCVKRSHSVMIVRKPRKASCAVELHFGSLPQ